MGPRLPGRPQPPIARGLRRDRRDRLPEPHVDAAGALHRRRSAALPPFPARAPRKRVPAGLRRVPAHGARRARAALSPLGRIAVHRRAEHQGVRGRAQGRAHRDVARRRQVRRAHAARADRQGVDRAARAGGHRRGAHVPLAAQERAPLLFRAQERRADARPPAADRGEPRLSRRGREPGRRALHARLLSAREGDPSDLAAPDRPVRGDALAQRRGRATGTSAGAGRRPRVSRWPLAPGGPRPGRVPPRARAPDARLLAPSPARLRAVPRSRTHDRGFARRDRRRLSPVAGGARAFSRNLPRVGPGGADVFGDARARRARPLSPGIRRADVSRSVRRLSQVLGRPAFASGRRAPRSSGAGAIVGIGRSGAGLPRRGQARAPHARHAPARHRQGQRSRSRGERHPARPGADTPSRPSVRRRGSGRVPRGPPPDDVPRGAAP